MNINYAVVGSDDNPLYLDFWPLVSKVWKNNIGVTPVLGLISNEDSDITETEYGLIKKFKKIDAISSSLQSQIVRLFLTKILNGYSLISDIDMLPLSKDYFLKNAERINNNNIIVYSSDNPECIQNEMYPMCYILAHTNTYSKIFDLNLSWEDFCYFLNDKKQGWYTDQKYIYEKINQFKNSKNDVILLDRGWNGIASRRIDRAFWSYYPDKVKEGYYIDSHLLRPYNQHKNEIDNLINLL
jgi:hypothetical protein